MWWVCWWRVAALSLQRVLWWPCQREVVFLAIVQVWAKSFFEIIAVPSLPWFLYVSLSFSDIFSPVCAASKRERFLALHVARPRRVRAREPFRQRFPIAAMSKKRTVTCLCYPIPFQYFQRRRGRVFADKFDLPILEMISDKSDGLLSTRKRKLRRSST